MSIKWFSIYWRYPYGANFQTIWVLKLLSKFKIINFLTCWIHSNPSVCCLYATTIVLFEGLCGEKTRKNDNFRRIQTSLWHWKLVKLKILGTMINLNISKWQTQNTAIRIIQSLKSFWCKRLIISIFSSIEYKNFNFSLLWLT